MQEVTRFAGYQSPDALVADPWLSRADKIAGLRSWRRLVLRSGASAGRDRELWVGLLDEIDRALDQLSED